MAQHDWAKDFLGVGWKFPVAVDETTGRIKTSQYEEDIQEAIRIIIMTRKGERVMQPEFGCGLQDYLFAGMDYDTTTQMRLEVQRALTDWEPRITDVEVRVETQNDRLMIHVAYMVRATNNPFNMVYPYFLSEGVEG
ncbi:MAG: GPW/gp25 family protein [Peptococcaceae bacterium]|jgi:phage baseplate assembly protein W|nr:GPW/gp25 family protein [Peptococcaceae bacterium]